MISKPSLAEREGSRTRLSEVFHVGLFYQQLQRQWPAGLMYFIILLFAFPVAAMLLMKEPEPLYSYFSSNIFALVYALFAGIFSGITVIRFLYHKDSTNFYHCLPVKRSCWLLTNTVSSLSLIHIQMCIRDRDEEGYIPAGEDCVTNVPGIFAAGDCRRKTVRQLTTAVADGAVAGLAACRYLDSLL